MKPFNKTNIDSYTNLKDKLKRKNFYSKQIQSIYAYFSIVFLVKPGDEPKPLPNVIPDNLKDAYGKVKDYFKSDKK